MTDALTRAGELALAEGLRMWRLDVYDPPRADKSPRADASRAVIDDILRAAGWSDQVPYKGDGQTEWCGFFAATCWREAGLDPKWLAVFFASTLRLDAWAHYANWNEHANPAPKNDRRLIAVLDAHSTSIPFEPRAGDVLMIGDGTPPPGDHITIVESYNAATRTFLTVEGNGVGLGPDGKRRQGVVRGARKLGGPGFCARRLIRPGFGDLLAEKP